MIQGFKTKTDKNGNTYTLEIDHEKKVYTVNAFPYSDYVVIGKRERLRMMEDLDAAGYRPRIQL